MLKIKLSILSKQNNLLETAIRGLAAPAKAGGFSGGKLGGGISSN